MGGLVVSIMLMLDQRSSVMVVRWVWTNISVVMSIEVDSCSLVVWLKVMVMSHFMGFNLMNWNLVVVVLMMVPIVMHGSMEQIMHGWLVMNITVVMTIPLIIAVVVDWDFMGDDFVNNLMVLSHWL